MANEGITDPSRFDDNQAGSGFNDLFLKVFAGEIIANFDEKNVTNGLVTTRSITSGKSASFPVLGNADATYHTAGQNIIQEGGASSTYLQDIGKTEKEIFIDDPLVAPAMLYQLDDLKNHYDARGQYTHQLGHALAKFYDNSNIRTMIAAARDSANLTQTAKTGGQVDLPNEDISAPAVAGTPAAYTAIQLINGFFLAAQKLDENDVPEDGRFAILKPSDYYTLITGADGTDAITLVSAANQDIGGSGSLSTGKVMEIAGIRVFKSNHIPSTNLSADATGQGASNNDVFGSNGVGYNGDFRNTVGVIGHPSAVGVVKLMDLATEMEWKMEYQSWLFLAKMACGHGVLRPESMLELVA
jgi:hypothetical protein